MALLPLKKYDKTHPDAHFMDTVFEYIRCHSNASAAADRLYIHRITFFYRMKRIKELTQLHFDNKKNCWKLFYTMLSKKKIRKETTVFLFQKKIALPRIKEILILSSAAI